LVNTGSNESMNQSHRQLKASTTIQLATHARALTGTKLNLWLGKRLLAVGGCFVARNPGQAIEKHSIKNKQNPSDH